MMNPFEYRSMMYRLFYEGELPEESQEKVTERRLEKAQAAIGKPAPKSAQDELAAMRAQAAELAAARRAKQQESAE